MKLKALIIILLKICVIKILRHRENNGHVTPDNNQTGVEFDIDALKVSFEIDCIIGVKAEINVDAIKGKNTFKYIFETALELITNKINRQDD